ncbi:hypothetical protein LshimejAT787_1601320 [Lyophyllum shimeji]|uniref:Uncharacterized protein n=1 Tax=Lyophyllum shimeji TaxID=47721 RepID=A0A9P3UTH6_LYOSH|nr:hypothetical protein LshimejAT787_1601320 [Lyophyllum shimeji]
MKPFRPVGILAALIVLVPFITGECVESPVICPSKIPLDTIFCGDPKIAPRSQPEHLYVCGRPVTMDCGISKECS